MKKPIKIGNKSYKYKKDALGYYKKILNSYSCGEKLTETDFVDVMDLLKLHEKAREKIGVGIKEVCVAQIRYNTKCFQIIRTDLTTDVFSYIKCINGGYSPVERFRRTCRDLVRSDLRDVKKEYFDSYSKKGKVKCQETGELCSWDELNVDHRQPNTFSIIVDRFIEVNRIDINQVKYSEVLDEVFEFEDDHLSQAFREYHRAKANLRLVKRKRNLGRSHQARLGRQGKDLTIEK